MYQIHISPSFSPCRGFNSRDFGNVVRPVECSNIIHFYFKRLDFRLHFSGRISFLDNERIGNNNKMLSTIVNKESGGNTLQ